MRWAFKEWQSICGALGEGRQSIILRKGGIAEFGGEFRPVHDQFWLYPTTFHQTEGTRNLGPGTIQLQYFAQVADCRLVTDFDSLLRLEGLHGWNMDTVKQRFHYRSPGLTVMTARVFRCEPQTIEERPEYAGCKSWVELDRDVEQTNSAPVLCDSDFESIRAEVAQRLS